jgi:5'-3' exonuclease
MDVERLHLVDGTFELFRAHYAKRPGHTTPDGRPFKAVAGLVSSLLYLLGDRDEAVTHVAIAFDNPIRSFRNDLYDGYKTEEGVDPELLAQFDAAEDAARALGIVVWSMDRWEADDALGTAAVRFADRVGQVRILSPDKDLGQVVRTDRIVLVDRIRQRVIDETGVRAARGVPPVAVPDLLALVGDTADGIPGLDGFGAKGAAAVLAAFGRIEDIPHDAARWPASVRGAERLARTLAAEREVALLYKRLATLALDVPLAEDLDDLRHAGLPASFRSWCERHGLARLAERAAL